MAASPYPIVFIVSPPRPGSTVHFQLLSHLYRLHYPDKLACRLTRAGWPRLGFALSGSLQRYGRGHNSFASQVGFVKGRRPTLPDECGDLFHRYLPRHDRPDCGTPPDILGLATFLSRRARCARTPMLLKNLDVDNWISSIAGTLAESRFIRIRRNPFYCAQSLLLARRTKGLVLETSLGPLPRRTSAPPYSEHDFVAMQIMELERQLDEDLAPLHAQGRATSLSYDALLAHPELRMVELADFMGGVAPRRNAAVPALHRRAESLRLDREDAQQLWMALKAHGAPETARPSDLAAESP